MTDATKYLPISEWENFIKQRKEAKKKKPKKKCKKRRPTLQKFCEKKPDYAYLLEEWDYEKNGALLPGTVKAHTQQKVWWKCQKGHEWQAMVMSRTRSNGTKCPYCSGRLVVKGLTDLASVCPSLAEEWNYDKNAPLTPQDVMPHSKKKVWWKCQKGHEWQAVINGRAHGRSCPVCYQMKQKFTPLSVHPGLQKEWNSEKNAGMNPEKIPVSSLEKVWWKCQKGHEWQAAVVSRYAGSGCPYCKGKRVIPGETDLASTHPEIARQWNYEKNEDLTPEMVSAGSGKRVWWICDKGHEWQTVVNARKQGRGCPVCAGKKPKK